MTRTMILATTQRQTTIRTMTPPRLTTVGTMIRMTMSMMTSQTTMARRDQIPAVRQTAAAVELSFQNWWLAGCGNRYPTSPTRQNRGELQNKQFHVERPAPRIARKTPCPSATTFPLM